MDIKEIFKDNGILKKKNKNYKKRISQIKAAILLEKAIIDKNHFILEGPCGFGKSIAYLIPSIKNFIETDYNGKIVLVTSNISLQEQLHNKDLPFVLDVFDELYPNKRVQNNIKPAVLKGIGNFLCIDKLEDEDFFSKQTLTNKNEMDRLWKYYQNTEDGDLTKSDFILSNEMRKLTTVDSVECKSNFCPYKDKCFYTLHRKKAQQAKVVVTNYHMLFSCMNANSSVFNDASLIVFDEAHEAEDILREFNASHVSIGTVEYIEKKIKEIENKLGRKNEILGLENTEKLSNYAKEFFKGIEERYEKTIYLRAKIIDSQKDLPNNENLVFMLNDTIRRLKKVKINIEQILDIEGQNQNNDDTPQEDLGNDDVKSALAVTKTLITTIENMVEMIYRVDDILQDKNIVMWVEIEKGVVVLGKKNIDVSQTFKRYFLEKEDDGACKTCILTSATISVDGNFEYLKNNLGFNLIDKDKVVEFMGKSPFNLTNQELWYLPKDALPGNDENFEKTITNQIEKIIKATGGGVLCLFTSNRNLNLCKSELSKKHINYKVYAQGDMGRNKLTELFKEDYNSNLLATKSFFTGIDIPGQSLRCIVIDKLPFTSPGDPVNQKLKMRPNYFGRYMLPQMIITLKQAVGRGVRSVDDKCVICILDERLSTATYKNKVLSSFKYKKNATRSLEKVKNFIADNK